MSESIQKIRNRLSAVRLDEDDLYIQKGSTLPFTVASVENFFDHPLEVPLHASDWADRVESARSISALYKESVHILDDRFKASARKKATIPVRFPPAVPKELRPVLADIVSSAVSARRSVKKALLQVPEKEAVQFLTLYDWPDPQTGKIKEEISSRQIETKVQLMTRFDQDPMLEAGQSLTESVDRHLPTLARLKDKIRFKRVTFNTPAGAVLLSGRGDDHYARSDTRDLFLLVDFGGNNQYDGPVAAADYGQIRIVIDFGSAVTIHSDEETGPSAGAGMFGIGLLYLPNPEGRNVLDVNSFGMGCGMGGVGVLSVHGTSSLKGTRYVQGVGLFGVGILKAVLNPGSTYWAERNAQGLGLTKGIGIFSHTGNNAVIQGGLVQPDPREPLGTVSLCQGVGFGQRAYAGGGIGIAVVQGDQNLIQGSYFAQGCGYFHGLGVYRLRGSQNTTQARRYDLGSGVHQAFGYFELIGHQNRVLNWGVGPAFGWDGSVGSALMDGSENEIQAEWGTGSAEIGSLSFSYLKGDRNKFILPDYGRGLYYRNHLAYSVHVLEGDGNRLQMKDEFSESGAVTYQVNPWGMFEIENPRIETDLKLAPPVWPKLEPEHVLKRESIDLQTTLMEAEKKEPRDRLSDYLDVASAFSLDKKTPKEAFKKLLAVDPENVPDLIELLHPPAVLQNIYLFPILAAYGTAASQPLFRKIDAAQGRKKSLLINVLAFHPPQTVIPVLLSYSRDVAVRRDALAVLSALLNTDTGAEPGTRAILRALHAFLVNPSAKNRKAAAELLENTRPPQAFGLLATTMNLSNDDRRAFYGDGVDDITEIIKSDGANRFLDMVIKKPKSNAKRIKESLSTLDHSEDVARNSMGRLLKSTKTADVRAGLIFLGRIGHPDDLARVTPFISHPSGSLREWAAVALGRMGASAIPFMEETMRSGNSVEKRTVLAALPHAVDKKMEKILRMGFLDPSAEVRRTALSVLSVLPPALKGRRKRLIRFAKRKLRHDGDAGVRFLLATMR